jgi:hypothetical protein
MLGLFNRPIARIYVRELRRRLEPLVVPIFTPDTSIEVGDFGSFDGGRFVRKGNLADRGVAPDVTEDGHAGFEFASAGKVSIGPSLTMPNPAGGGELVKATLNFERSQAVVVSFRPGVDRSVRDADAFGETLVGLWASKELRTDRAVVWSVRRAGGGTVVVSEEGDNEVELVADSALLGAAGITLSGLSAGVTFGFERKATWKLSTSTDELVIWARLYRLDRRAAQAVDAFGFEPGSPELAAHVKSIKPVAVSADDVLSQLGDESEGA